MGDKLTPERLVKRKLSVQKHQQKIWQAGKSAGELSKLSLFPLFLPQPCGQRKAVPREGEGEEKVRRKKKHRPIIDNCHLSKSKRRRKESQKTSHSETTTNQRQQSKKCGHCGFGCCCCCCCSSGNQAQLDGSTSLQQLTSSAVISSVQQVQCSNLHCFQVSVKNESERVVSALNVIRVFFLFWFAFFSFSPSLPSSLTLKLNLSIDFLTHSTTLPLLLLLLLNQRQVPSL